MKKNPYIQKLLSFLLIVFFTVSFIPKSIFHDLIASHTDAITCEHQGEKDACVHQQGFKCSFNDLVVTVPYVSSATGFSLPARVVHSTFSNGFYTSILQSYFFGTESRGPPAVIG